MTPKHPPGPPMTLANMYEQALADSASTCDRTGKSSQGCLTVGKDGQLGKPDPGRLASSASSCWRAGGEDALSGSANRLARLDARPVPIPRSS